VAWTLVGMVGIDPGEAVAAGWPGPHLKDDSLLLSFFSYLSIHSASLSYSFADDGAGSGRERKEGERDGAWTT